MKRSNFIKSLIGIITAPAVIANAFAESKPTIPEISKKVEKDLIDDYWTWDYPLEKNPEPKSGDVWALRDKNITNGIVYEKQYHLRDAGNSMFEMRFVTSNQKKYHSFKLSAEQIKKNYRLICVTINK
jgi:hypothetical protein